MSVGDATIVPKRPWTWYLQEKIVILFFLGSGPVRGFAVVFILGILTTVITAVTLTRMMIALWYHWMRPKALPF